MKLFNHKTDIQNMGKFEHRLRKSVVKKIVLLLIIGIALFIAGLFIVTYSMNVTNARNNLNTLKSVYLTLYQKNKAFLMDQNTIDLAKKMLKNEEEDISDFKYAFQKFNLSCSVKNRMILSDAHGRVVATTYTEENLSNYLINYNAAICYNARNSSSGTIYNAVYYGDMANYSDYMFVLPIEENGEILGFLSLFLSGDDLNYYLLNHNYDGVITDDKNNVIYASKPKLIGSSNKFYGKPSGQYYYNKERFHVESETLPDYHVRIYSLVYNPKNSAFAIGLFVILIMGLSWYFLANWMANSMARNNATLIGRLLDEIHIIQHKNPQHRIQIHTQDEFGEVAAQINRMLDSINQLNSRNTELLQLKNTIEMSQLTAQMNPHFLYNTLEIIRNLVLLDPTRAERLIVQMTQILRYSIDNSREDVLLEDDMQYIRDYLDIQKCRFGDHFHCTIDIHSDCRNCMIPKLVLQPIIENSIKYGFRKKMDISIKIIGRMEGNLLLLSVEDDGMGMQKEKAQQLRRSLGKAYPTTRSYGLHNIARRLFLRYGKESGIEIINHEGVGFTVIIRVMQPKEGEQCTKS
jgi:two-component system, sensor histidine kinase YesM